MDTSGAEMDVTHSGPDPWEIGDAGIAALEGDELHVRAWRSWAANRQLFTSVNGGKLDLNRGHDYADRSTFVREDAVRYVVTAREHRKLHPDITPEAPTAASAAARSLGRGGPRRPDRELLAAIRKFFPDAQIEKIVENGAQVWVGDAPTFGPDAEPLIIETDKAKMRKAA